MRTYDRFEHELRSSVISLGQAVAGLRTKFRRLLDACKSRSVNSLGESFTSSVQNASRKDAVDVTFICKMKMQNDVLVQKRAVRTKHGIDIRSAARSRHHGQKPRARHNHKTSTLSFFQGKLEMQLMNLCCLLTNCSMCWRQCHFMQQKSGQCGTTKKSSTSHRPCKGLGFMV